MSVPTLYCSCMTPMKTTYDALKRFQRVPVRFLFSLINGNNTQFLFLFIYFDILIIRYCIIT